MKMVLAYGGAFLAGAGVWTLVEYALHRSLGHRGGAKNPFTVEHLAHHADLTYFAPAWKKGLAACAVLGITSPLLVWFFGGVGMSAAIGFVLMYILYEYIHKRLHTHPPLTRYGRWARRHHLYHHFKRPHFNHGVTTPVWDFAFRTLEVPPRIRVPRRNALAWMLDERGELRAEFEADFELVGKMKQAKPEDGAPTLSPA
jgi:sterol desaturase/sphingolipid hydroxylase (fatty acid hydroxylase superfamily)